MHSSGGILCRTLLPNGFRCLVVSSVLMLGATVLHAGSAPEWAYVVSTNSGDGRPINRSELRHVPDSSVTLTRGQLDLVPGTNVPDWHPEEHPTMPGIVAKGRAPGVYACAYCHLPNGAGRPENTSIVGLSPAYFKEQVLAFRNGQRNGSEPKRAPQSGMIGVARGVTDGEIDEAAAYFAALKPSGFVKVIETMTVPKTIPKAWMLVPAPGGGTEPIGSRIIEIAPDFARFENRDSRTPYIAYVPVGSVARGGELATTGAGKTLVCATCHGPEWKGQADFPRLAGRSPSYLARQLHDIQNGTRTGALVAQMLPVVEKLTDEDIVALAAFFASRAP